MYVRTSEGSVPTNLEDQRPRMQRISIHSTYEENQRRHIWRISLAYLADGKIKADSLAS